MFNVSHCVSIQDLIFATYVVLDLNKLVLWQLIKGHTLESSYIAVMSVERVFHGQEVWQDIWWFTPKRGLMLVMFVGRGFTGPVMCSPIFGGCTARRVTKINRLQHQRNSSHVRIVIWHFLMLAV